MDSMNPKLAAARRAPGDRTAQAWWPEETGPTSGLRSIALIQVLAEEGDGLSVRRIAELTGASRSAIHRLLQELAVAGMAVQTENGSYSVGPRLYELAACVLSHSSLVKVADLLMRELVDRTGETAYIAMLSADRTYGVHIHRVDCREPLRYLVPTGSRFPLHAGAAGKAILAFMSDADLGQPLEQITPGTVTNPAQLKRDLAKIRERGFSVTREERVKGATGVAAPLVVSGAVTGSLTVSVPVARIPEAGLESLAPLVVECAARISSMMSVIGASDFEGA